MSRRDKVILQKVISEINIGAEIFEYEFTEGWG